MKNVSCLIILLTILGGCVAAKKAPVPNFSSFMPVAEQISIKKECEEHPRRDGCWIFLSSYDHYWNVELPRVAARKKQEEREKEEMLAAAERYKEEEERSRLETEKILKEIDDYYADIENQRIENIANSEYSEEQKKRLREKSIWLNMTTKQAVMSLGKPMEINRTMGSWGTHEQWVYYLDIDQIYMKLLYFENGLLMAVQD